MLCLFGFLVKLFKAARSSGLFNTPIENQRSYAHVIILGPFPFLRLFLDTGISWQWLKKPWLFHTEEISETNVILYVSSTSTKKILVITKTLELYRWRPLGIICKEHVKHGKHVVFLRITFWALLMFYPELKSTMK